MNVDAWAAVVVWPLMLLAAWLAGAWAARWGRSMPTCRVQALTARLVWR